MPKIHGMIVTLLVKTAAGKDPLGVELYEWSEEQVDNVLVAPVQTGGQDVIDAVQLLGKKCDYVLGIPKGDTHNWEDTFVEFFGKRWRTHAIPTEGIEDLIPLDWNKKVLCERYE